MATSRPRQRPPQRPSGSRGGRVLDFRPVPSARLLAVYLILSAGVVGLAARLAWVQVVQGPQLLNRARAVQTQTIAPIGKRRTIVDRTGRMVALDEERFTVWAHPRYFNFPGDAPSSKRPPLDVAQKLAPILGLPVEALMATIGSGQTGVKLATGWIPKRPIAFASWVSVAWIWSPTPSGFTPGPPVRQCGGLPQPGAGAPGGPGAEPRPGPAPP